MVQKKNVMKMKQMSLLALKYQVQGVRMGRGICEQREPVDILDEGSELDCQNSDT